MHILKYSPSSNPPSFIIHLQYPVCTSTWQVLAPELTGCIGHGILMACLNPMLCYIVDLRHSSQYGLINGFYTSSYNFALGVGESELRMPNSMAC